MAAWTIAILCGLAVSGAAVASGIRRTEMKWYDRAIRIFGGGFLFLVGLFAALVFWVLHS